jgi:hypothetical protein
MRREAMIVSGECNTTVSQGAGAVREYMHYPFSRYFPGTRQVFYRAIFLNRVLFF